MVLLQLMQDISVRSGLRSSFIDVRGRAVGSAIIVLDNGLGIGKSLRGECRSRASVPELKPDLGRWSEELIGPRGQTRTLIWPGRSCPWPVSASPPDDPRGSGQGAREPSADDRRRQWLSSGRSAPPPQSASPAAGTTPRCNR